MNGSIHDIYAYLKAINKDSKFWYDRVSKFQYDLVFLLAPWKEIYVTDYHRVETFDEAKHYYSFIKNIYSESHQIIHVPEGKIESRINFIKDKLNSYE